MAGRKKGAVFLNCDEDLKFIVMRDDGETGDLPHVIGCVLHTRFGETLYIPVKYVNEIQKWLMTSAGTQCARRACDICRDVRTREENDEAAVGVGRFYNFLRNVCFARSE